MMRLIFAMALIGLALPADAACYADYKAKQDAPLRLHYGVAQVSDAACGSNVAAKGELADVPGKVVSAKRGAPSVTGIGVRDQC